MKKSWRTTFLGVVCLGCSIWAVQDNLNRNAKAFRYWQTPIALAATGLMGLMARDHKHKDLRGSMKRLQGWGLLVGIVAVFGLSSFAAKPPSGGGSGWRKLDTNLSRWTAVSLSSPQTGDVATVPISSTWATYTAFVLTNRSGSLLGKTITATFTVTPTSGDPGYVWGCYNCPGDYGKWTAARLYFASRTDYSNSQNVQHYWFAANGTLVDDGLGTVTISTIVQPQNWSHGLGCNGSVCLSNFTYSADNPQVMGISLGSEHYFDLGVATTNGTAVLHLHSFIVQ